MYGESHDLVHEFPEYREKIHELKMTNGHFSTLFDEYHNVNTEVLRIEDNEPTSDAYAETLKKKRLALKDELFHMLKEAA